VNLEDALGALPFLRLSAEDSGVHRLVRRLQCGDGSWRKEVSIIVASIAHDVWLGSTLTLAGIVGLLTILSVVARRVREETSES
jgi:hypothetical protein